MTRVDFADMRACVEERGGLLMPHECSVLLNCADLLVRMLDPAWWREEVDSNGEYTTSRTRGYYEVVGDIKAVLGAT